MIRAAVILQLYGGIDPDYSRDLATRIVRAVDRVSARGHLDAWPTDEEIVRAQQALLRRGHALDLDDVQYGLACALVRGWGE